MTKREMAVLACRLFALYAFVQFLLYLESLSYSGWAMLQMAGDTTEGRNVFLIAFVIQTVFLLLFAILIWWKADWLASRMLPGADVSAGASTLTAGELQTVAFTVVGLVMIAFSLPQISGIVFEYKMRTADSMSERLPSAWLGRGSARFLVQFVLGVVLLFGSRGLTGLVRTMRTVGLRKDAEE